MLTAFIGGLMWLAGDIFLDDYAAGCWRTLGIPMPAPALRRVIGSNLIW